MPAPTRYRSRPETTTAGILDAVALHLPADPPPLIAGDDGVIRVAGTRVPLDTVVEALREGLTAEEVQQQYPSLELKQVYAAITFYLHHQADVEEYLHGRARHREEVRREVQSRFDPAGIRKRLIARGSD